MPTPKRNDTYSALSQLDKEVQRDLHRLEHTLSMSWEERITTHQKLEFWRVFTGSLANEGSAQKRQALDSFQEYSRNLLKPLIEREHWSPSDMRFVRIFCWSIVRLVALHHQGGLTTGLKRKVIVITERFDQRIYETQQAWPACDGKSAPIVNKLLESYHAALYELLGTDLVV